MNNVILIHGGVGSKGRVVENMDGMASKNEDHDPLNAVVKAVVMMENDERFNAGTGSVMRIDGSIQMDAAVAIPNQFGAVISIERVKNPVLVARGIMERTHHIALSGSGAQNFARKLGFEDYDPSTEKSKKAYERMKEILSGKEDTHDERYDAVKILIKEGLLNSPHDTVGAVSRINEKFAAAVSTGGASPMMRGRVGDVPLIGAGIYCGDKGAVVATGIGEEIAKRLLCFRIYEKIGQKPLKDVLEEEIEKLEGKLGGVIAVSGEEYANFSNGIMPTDSYIF
jgi:L-asparaginase/beta-aspartyl-peptidase (threonine type)